MIGKLRIKNSEGKKVNMRPQNVPCKPDYFNEYFAKGEVEVLGEEGNFYTVRDRAGELWTFHKEDVEIISR